MESIFYELEWPFVFIGMMLSLAAAMILSTALAPLNKYLKFPIWTLVVALPLIILLTALIDRYYVIAVILSVVIILAVVAIITQIVWIITSARNQLKKAKNKAEKTRMIMFTLENVVFGAAIVSSFIFFGPKIGGAVIFIGAIVQTLLKKRRQGNFLALQASLPTSKIQSMAMGLVELRGKTVMLDAIATPMRRTGEVENRDVIGYIYTKERIDEDDDGKESFSTVEYEMDCNPFNINDGTGEVLVSGEQLDLKWLSVTDQYRSGTYRYSQRLLFDDTEILLVGKATRKKRVVCIVKDETRKVFTLAPAESVDRWNKYKPLMNSAMYFLFFFLLLLAYIMLSDISISEKSVLFDTESAINKIKNLFNTE